LLKKKSPLSITFYDEDAQAVGFLEGETLLDLALRNKWEVPFSCGGYGTCGTCRVFIHKETTLLNPRNEIEQEFANTRGFQKNERLACQVQLEEGMQLTFSTNLQPEWD
jgi:2Fe-2S ferredoxin